MTNYAGDPAVFPTNVRLSDDGLYRNATELSKAPMDLADRTANVGVRVTRIEQILSGIYSQAVTLLGAFWAKANSTFGAASGVDATSHDVFSLARFHGTTSRIGPEVSSTVELPDSNQTVGTYKRHIIYNVTSSARILDIAFTAPVWSSFTVWVAGSQPVAVVIASTSTSIGTVPAGSHRTFRADASGVLHMYD